MAAVDDWVTDTFATPVVAVDSEDIFAASASGWLTTVGVCGVNAAVDDDDCVCSGVEDSVWDSVWLKMLAEAMAPPMDPLPAIVTAGEAMSWADIIGAVVDRV